MQMNSNVSARRLGSAKLFVGGMLIGSAAMRMVSFDRAIEIIYTILVPAIFLLILILEPQPPKR